MKGILRLELKNGKVKEFDVGFTEDSFDAKREEIIEFLTEDERKD